MSGRKKNRKHRHGQPPHELLNELSSLHELLGSDMDADIPLLDQVATSDGSKSPTPPPVLKPSTPSAHKEPSAPREPSAYKEPLAPQQPQARTPLAPPRPLEEADLPILFSPIDEELTEEYAPMLSDADRELLRPLQDLPRAQASHVEKAPAVVEEQKAEALPAKQAEPAEEFQPGLFDAPRAPQPAPAEQESTSTREPEPPAAAQPQKAAAQVLTGEKVTSEKISTEKAPSESVQTAKTPVDKAPINKIPAEIAKKHQPILARATSENPFLPPHIRARLTGGRVPKPELELELKPAKIAPEPQPEVEETRKAEADPVADPKKAPDVREQLIEQLMAEQLPELERQLRANITALVDEIYPAED